jgi:hypothetical protein
MSRFHAFLRWAAGRRDRAVAWKREQVVLRAAAAPESPPALREEMRRHAVEDSCLLGHACSDPKREIRLGRGEIADGGHALVLGASGAGKTRAVGAVVRSVLGWNAACPSAIGFWLQDHKSDVVALTRCLIADMLDDLPRAAANGFIDRLVVFNPFSADALVPFNVLAPEPGVAPEAQAFEVSTVVDRMGGATVGVKQDDCIFHGCLLGIVHEPEPLTLVDVARLLEDPDALAATASHSPSPAVRTYFAGKLRIPPASLEGVRTRLRRLLRLPATRLMLGSKRRLSFRDLLEERIVLVDLGSPPLGCEDIGRFWAGLVTLKLTRAVFERNPEEENRPVAIFVDEWQEGLAAGGDVAEQYERVLSLARSRSCSFWAISQSLAGAAKVSASLPKIVSTNMNLQLLFRASPEDAHAMRHMLPVTGRRARERNAPWEETPRSPYLSKGEELEQLTVEATRLPDRTFYLWNRRGSRPATLVRAAEVSPRAASFRSARLAWRLRHGALAVPCGELAETAAETALDLNPPSLARTRLELRGPPRRPRGR